MNVNYEPISIISVNSISSGRWVII
jgi:hypothetical protein